MVSSGQIGAVKNGTALQSSRWLMPLFIVLLTVAVFLPVLENGFVDWDDKENFLENHNYRGLGWQQLRWMFTTFHMGHYQPLSWVTLGLDFLLWGMNPFGYHLTNLLLHAVNAVLFYFLTYRLLSLAVAATISQELSLRISAGLATLFFAIHPLRVESVAWATERRDILSALFFLLTIHLYLWANGGAQSSRTRMWRLSGSLVVYGLSLLSKAAGMTIPVVLLVLDVYPLRRLGVRGQGWFGREARGVWVEKVPYLILASAAGTAALLAQYLTGAMKSFEWHGAVSRMAQAFFGLVVYLWKTIFPLGLSPLYEIPPQLNPWEWHFLLSGILVVGISLSLLFLRRRWPAGLAVWVCYVAILAPVLGIAQSGTQLVADRYSYLSCLGWAILVGAGSYRCWRVCVDHGFRRLPILAIGLVVIIVVGLSRLTWKQTQIWHDTERLWRHALAIDQESRKAHNNMGVLLAHQGKLKEAIQHYYKAIKLDPNYMKAYNNLGGLLARQGKWKEAIQQYYKAIKLDPNFVKARNNLGDALWSRGKFDEAIQSYHEALRIDPGNVDAHYNLGNGLRSQGKLEEAIEHYRQALQVNPGDSLTHNNLGIALVEQGKINDAIDHFRESLRTDPTIALGYANLANIFTSKGEFEKAIELYRKALELKPGFAEVHERLGRLLTQQGRGDEAIPHLEEALRIMK